MYLTKQLLHLLGSEVELLSPWCPDASGSQFSFSLRLRVAMDAATVAPLALPLPSPQRSAVPGAPPAVAPASGGAAVHPGLGSIELHECQPSCTSVSSGTADTEAPLAAGSAAVTATATATVEAAAIKSAAATEVAATKEASEVVEAAAASEAPTCPLPPSLRVLIVEDVAVNAKLLRWQLLQLGERWEVEAVASVEAALTMLVDEARRFDLILMDEHLESTDRTARLMRGTDGIRKIREHERQQGHAPAVVISCTGYATLDSSEGTQLFEAAGADHVWGKPTPDAKSMRRDLERLLVVQAGCCCERLPTSIV